MATVMESHVFGGHLWDFVNDGRTQSRRVSPSSYRVAHSFKRTICQAVAGAAFSQENEGNDTTIVDI